MSDRCIYCGWTRETASKNIGFYALPSEPGGRRLAWTRVIGNVKGMRKRDKICSIHFHSGRPSLDPMSADFVPNRFLKYATKGETAKLVENKAIENVQRGEEFAKDIAPAIVGTHLDGNCSNSQNGAVEHRVLQENEGSSRSTETRDVSSNARYMQTGRLYDTDKYPELVNLVDDMEIYQQADDDCSLVPFEIAEKDFMQETREILQNDPSNNIPEDTREKDGMQEEETTTTTLAQPSVIAHPTVITQPATLTHHVAVGVPHPPEAAVQNQGTPKATPETANGQSNAERYGRVSAVRVGLEVSNNPPAMSASVRNFEKGSLEQRIVNTASSIKRHSDVKKIINEMNGRIQSGDGLSVFRKIADYLVKPSTINREVELVLKMEGYTNRGIVYADKESQLTPVLNEARKRILEYHQRIIGCWEKGEVPILENIITNQDDQDGHEFDPVYESTRVGVDSPRVVEHPRVMQHPSAVEHTRAVESPRVMQHPRAVEHTRVLQHPRSVEHPRAVESPRVMQHPRAVEHTRVMQHPRAVESPRAVEQPRVVRRLTRPQQEIHKSLRAEKLISFQNHPRARVMDEPSDSSAYMKFAAIAKRKKELASSRLERTVFQERVVAGDERIMMKSESPGVERIPIAEKTPMHERAGTRYKRVVLEGEALQKWSQHQKQRKVEAGGERMSIEGESPRVERTQIQKSVVADYPRREDNVSVFERCRDDEQVIIIDSKRYRTQTQEREKSLADQLPVYESGLTKRQRYAQETSAMLKQLLRKPLIQKPGNSLPDIISDPSCQENQGLSPVTNGESNHEPELKKQKVDKPETEEQVVQPEAGKQLDQPEAEKQVVQPEENQPVVVIIENIKEEVIDNSYLAACTRRTAEGIEEIHIDDDSQTGNLAETPESCDSLNSEINTPETPSTSKENSSGLPRTSQATKSVRQKTPDSLEVRKRKAEDELQPTCSKYFQADPPINEENDDSMLDETVISETPSKRRMKLPRMPKTVKKLSKKEQDKLLYPTAKEITLPPESERNNMLRVFLDPASDDEEIIFKPKEAYSLVKRAVNKDAERIPREEIERRKKLYETLMAVKQIPLNQHQRIYMGPGASLNGEIEDPLVIGAVFNKKGRCAMNVKLCQGHLKTDKVTIDMTRGFVKPLKEKVKMEATGDKLDEFKKLLKKAREEKIVELKEKDQLKNSFHRRE